MDRHSPSACRICGAGLEGARETGIERRQVTEIPPVKAEVTEHQMIEMECPCCGDRTKADAPQGAGAPVQYGPRVAALGTYLWHGQFLSRARACAALAEMFGCAPSPGALAAQARKIAGLVSPALAVIIEALAGADVAHFDETGFRVAGKLAWVHSASAGKFALVTVHPKRGKEGMDAAGVLPAFAGIACHDAWKPYDGYEAARHALCNAHLLRELTAVTETGTEDDVIWAQQAIDALLALKEAADAARDAGAMPSTRRSRTSNPGEVKELQISLAGAEDKLVQIDQRNSRPMVDPGTTTTRLKRHAQDARNVLITQVQRTGQRRQVPVFGAGPADRVAGPDPADRERARGLRRVPEGGGPRAADRGRRGAPGAGSLQGDSAAQAGRAPGVGAAGTGPGGGHVHRRA